MSKPDLKTHSQTLLKWYQSNGRPLPWRKTKDPYKIWIAEIMLQQTTVTAVLPYYERFLAHYPNLTALAQARIEDVYALWAGLGYYSRARNLLACAQVVQKEGWGKDHSDLIRLPGLGPYTSRAISSFAFGEAVGVLDGNVIRFLSRFHGLSVEWWTNQGRKTLQTVADDWMRANPTPDLNQALIEIGAMICSASAPRCVLCPFSSSCKALKTRRVDLLPLSKPRRKSEIWLWRPEVIEKAERFALVGQSEIPFLKKQVQWPGTARKLEKKPKTFDFKHSITHHQIYVQIQIGKADKKEKYQWRSQRELLHSTPSSLVRKVLGHLPSSWRSAGAKAQIKKPKVRNFKKARSMPAN